MIAQHPNENAGKSETDAQPDEKRSDGNDSMRNFWEPIVKYKCA